jgi:hypothetical protein
MISEVLDSFLGLNDMISEVLDSFSGFIDSFSEVSVPWLFYIPGSLWF